jgi:hypothetical protein
MGLALRILANTLLVIVGCGGKLAEDDSGARNASDDAAASDASGDSAASNTSGLSPAGAPQGCSIDSALRCPGGTHGYSCLSNPETDDSMLSCSTPTTALGYCCFRWSYPIDPCTPDNALSDLCPAPGDAPTAFAYQCNNGADNPTSLNSALTCGAAVPDADGVHVDFCCAFK